MHIGDYKKRITIQRKVITTDESTEGIPIESWVDFLITWAAVMPLGGKEVFIAQALQGENPYSFRMRYKKTLDNTMRIAYQGNYFRITNIQDVNMLHRETLVLCMQEIENG